MNRIEQKVSSARRRLILAKFGKALCVTLFVGLIAATIAVAIPALKFLEVDFNQWTYAWIGGASAVAVLVAGVYAIATAPSQTDVAAEVDRRFGLRERVSSSMSLDQADRDTDFGLALMADAEKRADQLAVADRFPLKPNRLGWLPIAIVPVLAIVLMLVEPLGPADAKSTAKIDPIEANQVRTAATQLKKRIQQQKRKADAEGLKEAKEMYEKMESQLDKITSKKDMDRKDAMIAMNDLKKQLEERREQLGSSEQMRRAMSQMKGLESGPGEKVAKSIEKGEFGKAEQMVKDLAKKMRDGELSEQDKAKLKKQVEQMAKAMAKAAEEHKQKKQELQQQIDKARKEGRGDDAAKMQQKMNQMQQKDAQMQQMGMMAEAMNQAAKAMEQGKASEAADAMQDMADQLGEMSDEMAELEDLEMSLDQLSQSKNQMRCQKCGGAGCQSCQGNGQFGMGDGQGEGFGMGNGNGSGDRPEEETDTNTYDTQVRGDVKKGKAIIAGFADGPNRKGISREDVKAAIQSTLSEESDPTENQTLPRAEQEHARQYFDRLREGT
ncbi:hypothetical protein K227x_08040 [Rubripirellula lacrimiformis]|uniref:Chromosome partition protein Smc n=1 Tax=Rubripirellula lacrimiformis TaxID=1930273 RepID=A0A517N5Y7_9BACT|nr:hypothetical protein [Rubripirellula lacrimiformis]QDT02428.1 hypothetical protein K227x_08040 [Rubripirellula lacrimiformis]